MSGTELFLTSGFFQKAPTMLYAILMLGGLIFIHELGHFLVAKWMGMPVETFSLGFGRRLFGFRFKETDVRLSMIPLGGYVKLSGYNPEEPDAEDPHGFLQQPVWKRLLFYSGGILSNLLLAWILMSIVGMFMVRVVKAEPRPSPLLTLEVVPGSPAEKAGMRMEDQVIRFGDLRFPGNTNEEAVQYIQSRPEQPIPLTVIRQGREVPLQVIPRNDGGVGRIGIRWQPTEMNYIRRPWQWSDPIQGVRYALTQSWEMTKQIGAFLKRLITFQAKSDQVSGPIGIVRQASQVAQVGWEIFLMMTAGISLQLAILNALPIPVLDGGHMAILVVEKFLKRDFSNQLKERLLTGGFFLLVGLMALVVLMDLWRLKP